MVKNKGTSASWVNNVLYLALLPAVYNNIGVPNDQSGELFINNIQSRGDREYFNKTLNDVIDILGRLGLNITSYTINQGTGHTAFTINGEFFKIPKDANDFVTLVKKAILKGAMNEDSNKDSK